MDVDACDGGAEQADGAEDGEASADIGWNRQGLVVEMLYDLAQVALMRVGSDDDAFDMFFGAELS